MNPDYQNQPAPYNPHEHVANTLSVTQAGETTVCDIKRHPIGLVAVYAMSGVLLLVVAVLAFGVAPRIGGDGNSGTITQIGGIVLLLLAIICGIYSFVATKVYWGNSWVVTSDSITQITQTSLFNRQSSQLSLGNLEDVTSEQNGVLTHLFNYGLLKVETAGERSKFQFMYCPNPNYYAQQILAAREGFEQGRRTEDPQRLYHEQGAYAPAPQPADASQYPAPQPPADSPAAPAPTPAPTPVATPTYPTYNPAPAPPPPPPPTTAYPDGSVDPGVNIGTE